VLLDHLLASTSSASTMGETKVTGRRGMEARQRGTEKRDTKGIVGFRRATIKQAHDGERGEQTKNYRGSSHQIKKGCLARLLRFVWGMTARGGVQLFQEGGGGGSRKTSFIVMSHPPAGGGG